ncbi:MAG: spermine synthase, partial [Deltaproteobacteria bacterium]
MVPSVILSVVVIGLSGMAAQILLLRELFVSFLGNELTFGIVLGEWILSEALGSWWGRRERWELKGFVRLQILFCASLFLGLLLSRNLKAAVLD